MIDKQLIKKDGTPFHLDILEDMFSQYSEMKFSIFFSMYS